MNQENLGEILAATVIPGRRAAGELIGIVLSRIVTCVLVEQVARPGQLGDAHLGLGDLALKPGGMNGRDEDHHQQPDDGDNHQQLDQRKSNRRL